MPVRLRSSPAAVREQPASPVAPGSAQAVVARRRRLTLLRQGWVGGVLIALVVAFSLASPAFDSRLNWINTSTTATEVLLLALGQTFVIITAGIDLSDGAVLGLSGMVGAWVMAQLFPSHGVPIGVAVALGFAAALVLGAVVGVVNGVLIGHYNVPAFVVTLGTLGICTGAADLVNNGLEISNIPAFVGQMGTTNLGGWLPVPVLIAAVLCVVTGVMLAKTRFGEYTYLIGDNKEAATRSGIAHKRHLIKVYVLSGLLAAVAGVLVMSRLAAASPASGSDDELNAIAAVVIGGTSLFGGRGTIVGSIVGTLIISVLLTGLIIINVPPFWQLIAVGVVLIAAVFIDQYSERLRAT